MSTDRFTHDRGAEDARRAWLAGLLLRRPAWFGRFAARLSQLASLGRGQRHRLERKAAVSLAGAALLLSLAGPLGPPPAVAESDATAATITVVNGEVAISNNGKCSLMEAILNARATAAGQMRPDCVAGNISGPDVVSLPTNGLFVLTAPHNTQHGPTGLPVITTDVVIEGNGATIRRSNATGTPLFRILDADPGVTFTLRNASIINGDVAPDWSSNINDEGYPGGGIYSQGMLVIEGSTVSGNKALGGGGVWATTVTVTNSTISNNAANGYAGAYGGGLTAETATITGSHILDNTLEAYYFGAWGGGVSADDLTMTDSTVRGNRAIGGFAQGNDHGGRGGGVSLTTGTITGSTISGNAAESGLDLDEDGLYGTPGKGGGVYVLESGQVTFANSTISGNEANLGGGVSSFGTTLDLIHTTVTGNHAAFTYHEYNGYGPYTSDGLGGGIYAGDYPTCGDVSLSGSILSGNTADDDGQEAAVPTYGSCTPTITTGAFNVLGHSGSLGGGALVAGPTDVVPATALSAILGPLAGNGGPTQTHDLPAGSPALDLAPTASCATAPINGVDQRGMPRGVNGAGGSTANECDAGSYELQPQAGAGGFLISPTSSRAGGSVAFTSSDIIRYDPLTGWSMFFDGSDVGINRNLSAFDVRPDGTILMVFSGGQTIPGVGKFMPQDIALFTPSSLGQDTAGGFSWFFDGSTNLLTTSAERIDALVDLGNNRVALSTAGVAAVKQPNGVVLKAQDEDLLQLNLSNGNWSLTFDGSAVPGLKAEDINAAWIDAASGDLYISLLDTFNLSGVRGNAKDIVKLSPTGGGWTPSLVWDGSAEGFKSAIDGLEMLP